MILKIYMEREENPLMHSIQWMTTILMDFLILLPLLKKSLQNIYIFPVRLAAKHKFFRGIRIRLKANPRVPKANKALLLMQRQ